MHQELSALALSDLPLAGQQALAKHPNIEVREALASSNLTHSSVLDELLEDETIEGMNMREYAVTRTTQAETVHEQWRDTQGHTMYPVRNPLMLEHELVKAAKSGIRDIALSAYINPATPERTRRKLKSGWATHITSVPRGARFEMSRAFTLVSANPWMKQQPTQWCPSIQQAIVWQPDTDVRTLRELIANGRKDGEKHPALNRTDIFTLTVEELLAANSVAATTLAIRKTEFTLENAVRILCDITTPESHIIGELVNRYGVGTLMAETGEHSLWRTPECAAAQWIAYSLHYTNVIDTQQCMEASETITILGDNKHRWESFIALTTDWYGDLIEAAETACQL